jgi:hypothetical protein
MWPFRKTSEGKKSPPPIDICCLSKQKEEAIRKKDNLELEIEAKLKSEHPQYMAHCSLIDDIKRDMVWRQRWLQYADEKGRDREKMVICAESDIISSLDNLKMQYKVRILDEACKKEGLLSTLRK